MAGPRNVYLAFRLIVITKEPMQVGKRNLVKKHDRKRAYKFYKMHFYVLKLKTWRRCDILRFI